METSRVRIVDDNDGSPNDQGDRPTTRGSQRGRMTTSRGSSHQGSLHSIINSDVNTSELADNVASSVADSTVAHVSIVANLRTENDRLQAEVARLRAEAPNQQLAEANKTIGELEKKLAAKVALLEQKADAAPGEDLGPKVELLQSKLQDTEEKLRASKEAEAKARSEGDAARRELERLMQEHASLSEKLSRETMLGDENSDLRLRVSSLEDELSASKDMLSAKATVELPSEPPEDNAVLTEAYKKIAELNTQLARLYAELTLARAEAQHLRGGAAATEPEDGGAAAAEARAAENQKHSQQIADLVSDIRHLQLDLEYHQQKLDQLIREKQQMMMDHKELQSELTEAKQGLEERDQMLKHMKVDLDHQREESKMLASTAPCGAASDSETLAALRSEAAAKDSALIVSHYELHKEKLVRDRLEQKNVKLMERMQKLMMVVEAMRKENVGLEKTLKAKDQQLEEKDTKMREASRKAKLAQGKAMKSGSRKVLDGSMDFEAPPQHEQLPRLDSARRRQVDAAGSRSGMSTPRSTRSPFTTR